MKQILIAILLLSTLLVSSCGIKTGTGEKIGMITKLAQSGFFCPTWEAEIIRGGLSGGTGVMGQAFHFTIENESLRKQIQDALDKQQEIKVFYHTENFTVCRSDSGDNFLDKVEIVAVGNTSVPTDSSTTVKPNSNANSNTQVKQPITTTPTGNLSRQQIAESVVKSNEEILNQTKEVQRQNGKLVDILSDDKQKDKK